jgi:hypothetical protein
MVNASGDGYEQEADHVAASVMRMPDPVLQRACACADCASENSDAAQGVVQRASNVAGGGFEAPDSVHDALKSGGQPLSSASRAFFEPRFGRDFSAVRVHSDSQASRASQAVNARAFTVGNSIAFGSGQYSPESDSGRHLLAHELTHVVQQSGGGQAVQRAETDTSKNCAPLLDSAADIDQKVNASLAAARTNAGTPPAGPKVAAGIVTDLADNDRFHPGRTKIEVWASTLPANKQVLPAQSDTKYAGVKYGLWQQPLFPILNPTMKVAGICIGSDKLGHFFQQGAEFHQTESKLGTAAAEEQSERSEGGGYGLNTTGVFSNADRSANRSGGKFYADLLASPGMTFAIASYISSMWNEEDHPSFYEDSVGHQVWANLLTGTWNGTSQDAGAASSNPLAITLTATKSGTFAGTFTVGGATGKILNGVITYDTTTVKATDLRGTSPTTATPISSTHLAFDWALGSDIGKGVLASRGEHNLKGTWGRGASADDRGFWLLSKP